MTNQNWRIGGSGSRECLKRLSRWLACPQYETQRLGRVGGRCFVDVARHCHLDHLSTALTCAAPPTPFPTSVTSNPITRPSWTTNDPPSPPPLFSICSRRQVPFTVAGPLLCT